MKIKNVLCGLLIGLMVLVSGPLFALGLSDYAENKVADDLFRATDYSATAPATFYVALYSTACTDSAAGTELTGGSYARVGITRATASWKGTHGSVTGASSGTTATISNAAAVTFPAATVDWTTATHWGIHDASTAGNLIVCAALTASRTITTGATASFAIDALTIQIDSN